MKKILSIILTICAFSTSAQQKVSVLFDFDESELTYSAVSMLDSLLRADGFMYKKLQLAGHTDSVGSHEYNNLLSRKRVNKVHEYLLNRGFPKTNIELIKAQGKREPLNENADEDQRQANRRVEIIIPQEETAHEPQGTLTQRFTDTTTKAGTNIILKNLNFVGGRHILLPQSEPILVELLNALIANPQVVIEIHGHICCARGAEDGLDLDTNTFDLSVNRAKEIYSYLIKNGISPSRLSYKGFGHSRPLVYPEDTEDKRTTNRRVEIRIVKK